MAAHFYFRFPLSAFSFLLAASDPAPAPTTPADQAVAIGHEMWSDDWFVSHTLIIGSLLVFLLACFVIRRRRRTFELFANASGRVRVAHTALADLVESAARQYGAAGSPRASFQRRRGQLEVYVRLKIAAGQKLPQFSNLLQMRIADSLREAFGLENLGGVHIIITGYTGEPAIEEASSVPYHGASPANPGKPSKPANSPRTDGDYFGSH